MVTTNPASRLADPSRFGKRPDVETVPATILSEQLLNEAALLQHQSALETLDALALVCKDLGDLATTLGVGKDQLRRKILGKARATLEDVAAWRVAIREFAAEHPSVDEEDNRGDLVATILPPVLPANALDISGWVGNIWEGDCIPLMRAMPGGSVDLVLADLPYGTTRNKWDSIIPLEDLWECYRHVLSPAGCVVLTSAQPFTSALVASKPEWFRYEWIWSKTIGSGQLNIHHQPLRTHESVLVFSPSKPPYFPQMEAGKPYSIKRKAGAWAGRGYSAQSDHQTINTGTRYPKSVLNVPNPRIKGGHPTQKPLALFEYLIKTYTAPGQVVLDNVIGSGTTAEAAKHTGRLYVGMELDPVFLVAARARVADPPAV